jgi:hypothetical protein
MKIPSVIAMLPLMVLLGCAATPEASPDRDAAAKQFEAASRAAVIYLYRADSPGSKGVSTVWVDGRLVGQTLPATYFRVIARPGRNSIHATGPDAGRLEIETRPDNVYFVAMNVLGEDEGSATTVFRSVAPEAGQAAIQRCCSLLETWRPGQWRVPL